MLGRTKAALGLAGSTASGSSSSSSSSESRLGVPQPNGSRSSTPSTATRRPLSRSNSASHRYTSSPQRAANHIGSVVDDWPMYSSQPEDYILGDVIGHGASSTVYQAAFQPLNGRACAVKVIDLEAFGRDTDELRRETQLMSLSKHPNVLRVRGCWVQETKLHIATRLMSSGSMLDIMRFAHTDGFHEDVICTVLKQALQGLDYLHVNGWLHRDLKAANLLVDEDGTVLLGDFGVGVWVGEGRSIGRSGSVGGKRKSFVGTPCWMAPEVISRRDYSSKADIWSFGITALELSQGHAPHSRLPPVKVLMKTLDEESPRLDMVGGAHRYSKTFADFVDLCLQKEPDKRPSAAVLLKHPFFKHAKPQKYLINAILADLPPLSERQERFKKRAMSIQTSRYLQSWDFNVESPTTSPSVGRMLNLTASAGSGSFDPFSGFEGSVSSPGPASARSSRIAPRRVRMQSSSSSTGATGESAPLAPTSGGGIVKKILSIDGEHAIVVEDEDGLEDSHPDFHDSENVQEADEALASGTSALALNFAMPASSPEDAAGSSTGHVEGTRSAMTSSPLGDRAEPNHHPEEHHMEGSPGRKLRIA
ncbi:kinase-like protein [Microstroma glucosiphilum]|uniref:Kinase-like protein n=1 Tax=Pseudomicrostroma glucosiphilum TaxID=1684307 RepID=A0A316U5X0_9BASI|nr:kinase-like protein [Pseudomicrostroma glucosiphilum]PWN20234.1 kinase-like protein [Pseudomicrostroma glucosiphilum]